MEREKDQKLHEDIIEFLNNKFKTEDKRPVFNVVPANLSSDKFSQISTNDINKAIMVFVKVLNLNGGSNSDVDLYKLLQVYMQNPTQRQKINELI